VQEILDEMTLGIGGKTANDFRFAVCVGMTRVSFVQFGAEPVTDEDLVSEQGSTRLPEIAPSAGPHDPQNCFLKEMMSGGSPRSFKLARQNWHDPFPLHITQPHSVLIPHFLGLESRLAANENSAG